MVCLECRAEGSMGLSVDLLRIRGMESGLGFWRYGLRILALEGMEVVTTCLFGG